MSAHLRKGALSAALVALLAWSVAACDAGEDNPGLTTVDGAVSVGDSGGGWLNADGAVGTPGGTGGVTAGGGTTGTGFTAGGSIAGGTPGGALDAGATGGADAGRDAATPRDTGVADASVAPMGDGGNYEALRQVCLDTINMYRAMVNQPPLVRASATLETCSDEGAKYDGDMNAGRPANMIEGHLSTRVPGKGRDGAPGRLCGAPPLGAQNTCPAWRVGPRTGNNTLADALKKCLAQMWAEGEPAQGVKACKDAYLFQNDPACFLAHGHWINMQEPTATQVSCGFYDMGNSTYWLNQDFVGR